MQTQSICINEFRNQHKTLHMYETEKSREKKVENNGCDDKHLEINKIFQLFSLFSIVGFLLLLNLRLDAILQNLQILFSGCLFGRLCFTHFKYGFLFRLNSFFYFAFLSFFTLPFERKLVKTKSHKKDSF